MNYQKYLENVNKIKMDTHIPNNKEEVIIKVKLLNGRKAKIIVPYHHTVNSIR